MSVVNIKPLGKLLQILLDEYLEKDVLEGWEDPKAQKRAKWHLDFLNTFLQYYVPKQMNTNQKPFDDTNQIDPKVQGLLEQLDESLTRLREDNNKPKEN